MAGRQVVGAAASRRHWRGSRGRRLPGRRAELLGHLALLAVCVGTVVLLHSQLLSLPYYWDEAGYYIPAARDFYLHGQLLPTSTAINPHPPLLSIYLAAAWKLFGFSPLVTRMAMAVAAGAAVYAVLLLAMLMLPPAAGWWATALTVLTPVFFAQSTLAHLDVPATLFTLLALYFYLRGRIMACAVAGTVLCLVRETGVVVVLVLAGLELWAYWRQARTTSTSAEPPSALPSRSTVKEDLQISRVLVLLLPLVPLAAWLTFLRWETGLWLGDRGFAEYNLWGVMNPIRWAMQLAKRLYQFAAANFHFVPAVLAVAGARWSRIPLRFRRVLVPVILAQVAVMSVLGGAPLTRYLLPAFPLLFLLAAGVTVELRPWLRTAVFWLLPVAFIGSWFWNPPYPFGYEDNLAYADFVRLHQAAVPMLEGLPAGTRILTAWPATDEMSRPWLGYVDRPFSVIRIGDFSREELERVNTEDFDALLFFSRQWKPEWFTRYPTLTRIQARYFGYRPQAPDSFLRQRFGMKPWMRTESRGQWVEIWVKSHITPTGQAPEVQKTEGLSGKNGCGT